MQYRILHESDHRIRFRIYMTPISAQEAEVLQFAFSNIKGVKKVTVYQATGGCALEYSCSRDYLLERLNAFRMENVELLAKTTQPSITAVEMRDRKLDPALKRKLRMRILAETAADILLPVPLQLGYHAWQMITLREY